MKTQTREKRLKVRFLLCGMIGVFIAAQELSATLSFYAPYDTNFGLTVGINPQPINTNGSPGLTPGFPLYGLPARNALDVPAKTNGLQYNRVDSYFTGVGNGVTIGSNTFRLLYKPDYSGVQGPFELRKYIFGGGPLGSGDSFAIYHADGPFHGPIALFSIGNVSYGAFGLSNFNWNSSTWYYMGVSFDKTGGTFFFQPMTNNSTRVVQTFAFGSTVWGAGFLDPQPLNIGIRPITLTEGAEGNIDDVKVFRSETWSAGNFDFDYAMIIPEPSTGLLLATVVSFYTFRRRRRPNNES